MSSQGGAYSSCPVFGQASSGVFINSLVNVMQPLPGTEKMAAADVPSRNQAGRQMSEQSSAAQAAEVTQVHTTWSCLQPGALSTHKALGQCYM